MPKRTSRRTGRRTTRRKTRAIRKRRVTTRRRRNPRYGGGSSIRRPVPVTSTVMVPTLSRPPTLRSSKRVKLRYAFVVTMVNATNGFGVWNLRGNSVYDPEYTTGGTQPRYFDQFGTIYDKYFVHGSSINATFNNEVNGDERIAFFIVAQPETAAIGKQPLHGLTTGTMASTVGAPVKIYELPRAKIAASNYPFYNGPAVIRSKAKTSTILEMKNQQKDLFYGNTGDLLSGSNPTNQWVWTLGVARCDGDSTAVNAARVTGYIDYDVTFFQPTSYGPS